MTAFLVRTTAKLRQKLRLTEKKHRRALGEEWQRHQYEVHDINGAVIRYYREKALRLYCEEIGLSEMQTDEYALAHRWDGDECCCAYCSCGNSLEHNLLRRDHVKLPDYYPERVHLPILPAVEEKHIHATYPESEPQVDQKTIDD